MVFRAELWEVTPFILVFDFVLLSFIFWYFDLI